MSRWTWIPVLAVALGVGCAPSEDPRDYHEAEAWGALEHLGNPKEQCTCTYNSESGVVQLWCTDKRNDHCADWDNEYLECYEYLEQWMHIPTHRNTREWWLTTWVWWSAVYFEPSYQNVWVEIEAGDNQLDPRDPDSLGVFFPLYLHRVYLGGGVAEMGTVREVEAGGLDGGRFWCVDALANPWDVDPEWRRVAPPPDFARLLGSGP